MIVATRPLRADGQTPRGPRVCGLIKEVLMNRRNAIATMGTAAVGVAGLTLTAHAQPAKDAAHMNKDGSAWERCAAACSDCVMACGKNREHCTQMADSGKGGHAMMAAMAADCGECCAGIMVLSSRMSMMAAPMAEGCAKCCDDCAAACEKMDGEVMKACAKACRDCAAACRQLPKKTG